MLLYLEKSCLIAIKNKIHKNFTNKSIMDLGLCILILKCRYGILITKFIAFDDWMSKANALLSELMLV